MPNHPKNFIIPHLEILSVQNSVALLQNDVSLVAKVVFLPHVAHVEELLVVELEEDWVVVGGGQGPDGEQRPEGHPLSGEDGG